MEFTTRFELQSQATRLRYTVYNCLKARRQTGLSPSLIPYSKGLTPGQTKDTHGTTPEGLATWALPASFAITEGILVSFFSSAYLYA
jgi:hypothetical protein